MDLLRLWVVPTAPTGLVGLLSQVYFADGINVEEEVPAMLPSQLINNPVYLFQQFGCMCTALLKLISYSRSCNLG
jgi:hypothetical protein